jgi:putative intracellular protease/amidase
MDNTLTYNGTQSLKFPAPVYDRSKKTVLVIADNDGTEMFDMMAPYYLFNATKKANVYVVAEKKYPISMKKGPFILPHFSFREIDSMKLHADVIVIPFMANPEGATKINWIKNHYSDSTKILAICDGAWTAAATGIYDGKPLTCHATDYKSIKEKFSKPHWVQQVSYTQSGNLFSTAGVSNAVEGSLAVIRDLFGNDVMHAVLEDINYYKQDILKEHNSASVNGSAMVSGFTKVVFKRNKKIGILLQDGISEFELAGIFDSYTRTLPSSINAYTINGGVVTTKYGLTLIPTGDLKQSRIDELHIISPEILSKEEFLQLSNVEIVSYHQPSQKYIINECLERIRSQYGSKFQHLVHLALDFN